MVNLTGREYLNDLDGYEPVASWGKVDDERQERWAAQRERYGFDDRQTWSLDTAILELLYERLKMFLEVSEHVIDLEYHTFTHREAQLTQKAAIEKLISLARQTLRDEDTSETAASAAEFWELWVVVRPAMWW